MPFSTVLSLFFSAATFGFGHFGDTEARYEADCWGMLAWHKCHVENFGNIHTPAYLAALRGGHAPMKGLRKWR